MDCNMANQLSNNPPDLETLRDEFFGLRFEVEDSATRSAGIIDELPICTGGYHIYSLQVMCMPKTNKLSDFLCAITYTMRTDETNWKAISAQIDSREKAISRGKIGEETLSHSDKEKLEKTIDQLKAEITIYHVRMKKLEQLFKETYQQLDDPLGMCDAWVLARELGLMEQATKQGQAAEQEQAAENEQAPEQEQAHD